MEVTLRDVDEKNFSAVIGLSVAEGQRTFVAPNVTSVAQSKVSPYLIPKAVYFKDEPVGFALYGRDPDDGRYWIVRLMIDADHQGKGLGKAAVRSLLALMSGLPECSEVFLSFVPDNEEAEHMYRRIGFERTGDIFEGEIVMCYRFDTAMPTQQGIT